MLNISPGLGDFGKNTGLIFHILGIFFIEIQACGRLLLVLILIWTEQVGAKEKRFERLGPRGWKLLRRNEVRWLEGAVLVYSLYLLFQVWSVGADLEGPDGSIAIGSTVGRGGHTRPG